MTRRRGRPAAPTMNSVAEAAMVSVSTVSRVVRGHVDVREDTRARVLAVIDRLGYRPSSIARALVSGHSPTLGLLISDITNPFYPQLAKSIERAARSHGYALVICNTDDSQDETDRYIAMLKDLGAGGIIQASGGPGDSTLLDRVGDWQRVVFTNRRPSVPSASYVVSDNLAGAVALTEHLIDKGHREIGFVAGPEYASNARERLAGYESAMKAHGLGSLHVVYHGDFSIDSGRRAVKAWGSEGHIPTAIIGVNDLVAVGAYEEVLELGLRVPEDVAIAGFDDIELADSKLLNLTSVRQHTDLMGAETVELLMRLLQSHGRVSGHHQVIRPDVAIRGSTDCRSGSHAPS